MKAITLTNRGAEIPLFSSEPEKSEYECKCQAPAPACGKLSAQGLSCTRTKGHTGEHVACGFINHKMQTWPQ